MYKKTNSIFSCFILLLLVSQSLTAQQTKKMQAKAYFASG
ncbi:MAG: hypothetical protein ACI834_000286, partial [Colwellia sp.]